jgi:DNA topoisomerase I
LATKSSTLNAAAISAAKSAGLRYVNEGDPGITREPAARDFRYRDAHGRRITDARTLGRIKRLAIPPAWTEVWICPNENGHIQATGRDARRRKQYRYHPDWRATRDQSKYERMIAFAQALPRIRRRITRDLRRRGLGREKVLATMVRLLETTLVRVGNEEYARTNGAFGLSTMRDRHAKVKRDTVEFSFRGKSGKYHRIALHDPGIARIVQQVQDLPGQELFQYVDAEGRTQDIKSDDVNAYLRDIAGEEFSAKDFRTWAGTVLAAIALQQFEAFETKTQAKKNLVAAVERVAQRLGNTPAVCRKCYIHPAILDSYLTGATIRVMLKKTEAALAYGLPALSGAEGAVLAFLQQRLRQAAKKPSLGAALQASIAEARARGQRRRPTSPRRPRRARDDAGRPHDDPARGREISGGARAAARSRTHKSPPSGRRVRAG